MWKSGKRRPEPNPARAAIRRAAIELFAEKGFAAASTREICARAQITKPVLYYYFKDKEHLYRELFLDACTESREQLVLAATRGATARDKLVEFFSADFELTKRDPDLALMAFRMVFAPRKESRAVDYVEIGMDWVRMVAGIVAEGVRRREIKGRPKEIAEAFMGIHMIYTISYLLTGEPEINRSLARRIVKLVLEGCGR